MSDELEDDDAPPDQEHPDMPLVRRLQQGDVEARNALMVSWYKLSLVQKRVVPGEDLPQAVIEELAMDAIEKALEKAAQGKVNFNPDGMYLNTLAGLASDERQKQAVRRRLADRVEDGTLDPSALLPMRDDGQVHKRLHIRRTLDKLKPEERRLILLADGEGMSSSEVAKVLGINPNTCKDRIGRARKAFLDNYEGPAPEDER